MSRLLHMRVNMLVEEMKVSTKAIEMLLAYTWGILKKGFYSPMC